MGLGSLIFRIFCGWTAVVQLGFVGLGVKAQGRNLRIPARVCRERKGRKALERLAAGP